VFIASRINKLTANLANLTKSFLDATASLRRSHVQITRLADDSFAGRFHSRFRLAASISHQ
jgi:hypothetical protein